MGRTLGTEDKVSRWDHATAADRIWRCMQMLYLHEFLTDAEYRRVRERVLRWRMTGPSAPSSGSKP